MLTVNPFNVYILTDVYPYDCILRVSLFPNANVSIPSEISLPNPRPFNMDRLLAKIGKSLSRQHIVCFCFKNSGGANKDNPITPQLMRVVEMTEYKGQDYVRIRKPGEKLNGGMLLLDFGVKVVNFVNSQLRETYTPQSKSFPVCVGHYSNVAM